MWEKMKTFKTNTTTDTNIFYVFTTNNESYFYSVEIDDNYFYNNSTEFYSLWDLLLTYIAL